jgi:transcription elongation GreA/GreB family factor
MITKLGRQKLEQQIAELQKEIERTFDERNKAAAEGDLKENSAYIYLGEQAQLLYTQIEEAKIDLKRSKVQDAPTQTKKVTFGHKVTIRFESDKREISITLVGKNDARLKPDWISCESPLGIALLDKGKSDKVLVNDQPVTILDISVGEI